MKRMHRTLKLLASIALSLGLLACAHAGQNCEDKPQTPDNLRKAFNLGVKVFNALEATSAQVAFIGRVGSDLSQYNLRYSHLGIVWRDHPKGRWMSTHLLNTCGTASSGIFTDGLVNFFADHMFAWEAFIIIPSAALQANLIKDLQSGNALSLHEARYNMLAYPFSDKYQNSNQWVLEALALASNERGLAGRKGAQSWLMQQGYQPSTLKIGTLTRLGGRMFKANIAFDDHPNERRFADLIDVVTVESIYHFLNKKGWVEKAFELGL